jgi:Na+/H+ antiporter NhaC
LVKNFSKYIIAIISLVAICAAAYFVAPQAAGTNEGRWYSIIPPVIAIILAFLTKKVLFSLGSAIIIAGFLPPVKATSSQIPAVFGIPARIVSFVINSLFSIETIRILSFIVIIFIMIEILAASGGFSGVVNLMMKFIRGRKSAQFITALLGVLFFIDDYANAMIIGSSMRPLTDRFGVSREKLSFLVDATSAPVTGLAVISTWIAYEVSLFNSVGSELGITKSGYAMFFDALQFRFYCVLMILFMFIHIFMNVDFGPMRTAEERAKGKDLSKEDAQNLKTGANGFVPQKDIFRIGRPVSAILPICGLVAFHLFLLWLSGGGQEKFENIGSLVNLSYWQRTISDVKNTSRLLVFSSTFGLILAAACAIFVEKLKINRIARSALAGIRHSLLPMAILILAWSLKNCCDNLKTGQFLASVIRGNVTPFLFPPLLFLTACVTSFATGTSWGTMAILIPTGIPVAYALDGNQYGITTMISLGAVLDGAIFGDHCSPVSDTTILSAIASKCDLMRHVNTQLPYSLFTAAIAMLIGYLPAAMGLNWIETVVIATIVIIILLAIIKKLQKPIMTV